MVQPRNSLSAVQSNNEETKPVGVIRDPSVVIDTNFEFNRHAKGMTPVPQGVQVYARRHPALSQRVGAGRDLRHGR